jgi:hypothetical protein
MSFWSDVMKAWKTSHAEKQWKKNLDKKPINEELFKEKAEMTANGEPWVGILRMEIDPDNLSNGAFELDWNDIFVARLVKAGYSGKDDKAIVEQWFNTICSNIVAGTYEDEIADPEKRRRIQRKQLDKERAEMF